MRCIYLKLGVPKRILFLVAATVWGIAADRILSIAFNDLYNNTNSSWVNFSIGFIGVYFFFKYVFFRIYLRQTQRIINIKHERPCIFLFLDSRGYKIMAMMITLGIIVKKVELIPQLYLGTFYLTLGLSLLLASFCFLYSALRYEYIKKEILSE